MPLHPPSLRTWSAAPSNPDGETGRLPVARLLLGVLSVVLAGCGVLMLLLAERTGWGLGLAAAGSLLALVRVRQAPGVQLIAAHGLLKVLVLLDVGLAYALARPGQAGLVWVAASLALLTVLAEPLLHRTLSGRMFVAAHLPGSPQLPGPRLPRVAVPVAVVVVAVLGGILALLHVTAWAWLGLTVVALTVAALAGCEGLSRARAARRALRGLAGAVKDYAPEFAVYAGRAEDASYQVTMWLPYLQRTGRRFIVITRAPDPGAALARLTDVPVVCCVTVAELEQVLVPSLTTVFYVNAASANGQMVRYHHLTHVHLGHGDSDKATSANPLHAMYDRVFVAGPAAIQRYAAGGVAIPPHRFAVVGRPQVEAVRRANGPVSGVDAPTVLYAPTWRGHVDETRLSSLPVGPRIVQALLDRGATVIFRPHPFSADVPEDAVVIQQIIAVLRADAARTGRRHTWGEQACETMSIFDCFNASDAMVSDVSSVVSDYLYSEKPLAMYSVGDSPKTFLDDFPVARAAYLFRPDLSDLAAAVGQLLGADPLRQARLETRSRYLGDFPEDGYADVFVREADRVIAGDGPHHPDGLEDLEDNDLPEDGPSIGPEPSGRPSPAGRHGSSVSRGELLASGPALTAVAGAATALAGAPLWVPTLLAAATLAVISWAGQPRLTRPAPSALGVYVCLRALLAVTVVGIVARGGEGDGSLPWLTLASLLLALTFEMWVRWGRGVSRLRVRQLPTLDYRQPKPAFHGWMFALGVAPLWLSLLLALARVPIWFASAVAIEAAVVGAALLLREVQLLHASEKGTTDLRRAIEEYQPQFVVYFAARTGAKYQLGMWLPYLESLGRRFIVVTRFESSNAQVVPLTTAPIVLCRTLESLEDTLAPTLTTVFYVNNGLKNTHYVERRELTHIWLNHGDSEKPACFNPVHAMYDKIFTAGQAGVDRYARHGVEISPDKFEIVGRPQLTGIDVATRPISALSSPTVLYAPTWVGPYADSRLYSLPVGRAIVSALLERGCTVIFRAHPNNYSYPEGRELLGPIWALLEEDQRRTGRAHRWGAAAERLMDVKDCFNASDAMISDVSAVVTDYLQSQKPFSMVAVDSDSERLVADAPIAVASHVLAGDLSNLQETLDNLLLHDDLAERRAATRDYYLGALGADSPAEPFRRAARRYIDSAQGKGVTARADIAL